MSNAERDAVWLQIVETLGGNRVAEITGVSLNSARRGADRVPADKWAALAVDLRERGEHTLAEHAEDLGQPLI